MDPPPQDTQRKANSPTQRATSLQDEERARRIFHRRPSTATHRKHALVTGKPGEPTSGEVTKEEEVRAVVAIVSVALAVVEPSRVVDDGETLQLAPFGRPLHVHATVLLNPPLGDKERVYVADSPAVTVRVDGLAEAEKSDDVLVGCTDCSA